MTYRGLVASVVFLTFVEMNRLVASVALVRDPGVDKAQTSLGSLPAVVQPIASQNGVSLVVLADTLSSSDMQRITREMEASLSSAFFKGRVVRLIDVSGGNVQFNELLTSAGSLPGMLKRIVPAATTSASSETGLLTELSDIAPALAGNWSHIVVVCRFPLETSDEVLSRAWLSGWIGDRYRAQHVRVSFWGIETDVPPWAQDLSQSTLGSSAGAIGALTPLWNDSQIVYQATWQARLKAGSWPCQVLLTKQQGERVALLSSLYAADEFSPNAASYVNARSLMTRAPPGDESAAHAVLQINPSDVDALAALGNLYKQQRKAKDAARVWRQLSDVTPANADVWVELGIAAFHAELFDDAAVALSKASDLGVKTRPALEIQALLLMRGKDYAKASQLVDAALALKAGPESNNQSLYLLRADCARALLNWPLEADSVERATALGAVPLERISRLIDGYLTAGQTDRALAHLHEAIKELPKDAATQCQYASLWEKARDDANAQILWRNAITADPLFEAAYVGLSANQLRAHDSLEALRTADAGLRANPHSEPLILLKEQVLEATGDLYAARRLLAENALGTKNANLLERRSRVEDWYGGEGADAYLALLEMLMSSHSSAARIAETSHRGLAVAIRDEKPERAKVFANKLAETGDSSGLALLKQRDTAAVARTQLIGGAEAFYFLLFGGGHPRPERILVDACRWLIAAIDAGGRGSDKSAWQGAGQRVHEYFKQVSALAALGKKGSGSVRIELTLNDKAGKQRTEKVFDILGLKLKRKRESVTLQSTVGKKEAKKQATLAALAIDEDGIQEALASGKKYILELPIDQISVFPAADLWQQSFYGHDQFPGGLSEALVSDPRIPRLYVALNSMDRNAAQSLLQAVSLRELAERYSLPLSLFSSALAIHGGHAEVPGGNVAEDVWLSLCGASPARPAEFFQNLLSRDDSRLIAFFYTLSQLDPLHQRFFTRSAERSKRFYALFREAPEMRRGGDNKVGSSSFLDFLRNVPLNEDGSVDFPGSPQVWMVAKGRSTSGVSVGKMTHKMKKSATPDDEDEILIRLANLGYKASGGQISELANFIAVTQIDDQREEPMGEDSALLLAQAYGEYRGLFPYFAELGDLAAADYQSALSFQAKLSGLDLATANLRAGEFHSFLALLGVLRESGLVPTPAVLLLYRTCLKRYIQAGDGATWTTASLSAVDDLSRAVAPQSKSRDEAIRLLLIGDSLGPKRKSFDQVLALQRVPSLDSLFAIQSALKKMRDDPRALDEIARQLAGLMVIPVPKEWKPSGERKKYWELFETAAAENTIAKLRDRLGKKKRNSIEIDKLAQQLLAQIEPWAQLAMTGRIYARYLDASDLLVSEDGQLLRKHEFISLGTRSGRFEYFPAASLYLSSELSGSRFEGGLAQFSLEAGGARAAGNHIGSSANQAFSKALIGSVRATEWRGLTSAELISFSGAVRLAREWIVASANSNPMRDALEIATRGILSINRRNALLEALDSHDWPAVWRSASISDLHFIGDALLEQAKSDLWNTPALSAMKTAAAHSRELDLLGSVAPDLNGCGQARLRRYEPYEEYQHNIQPARLAERSAELKLYLAWMADGLAWPSARLAELAPAAADHLLGKTQMHDGFDWEPVLDALRSLNPEEVTALEPAK